MHKWYIRKPYISYSYEEYPQPNQEIWIEMPNGIYKGKYTKWDWSDSSASNEFLINEGYSTKGMIAWMPYSDNQPERSKREDLDKCPEWGNCRTLEHDSKMRCSEHCVNTVRDK